MFVVTVTFEVKKEAIHDFHAAVLQQANDSLTQEPGCRRFDVCVDPARRERVFLYEIYDDSAAFDSHRRTRHYARFIEVSAPLLAGKVVETWQLQEKHA